MQHPQYAGIQYGNIFFSFMIIMAGTHVMTKM
jgi:hypothetical protein